MARQYEIPVFQGSDLRLDSSLDLMRRLPPQGCEKHLSDLVTLSPDLCESLLTAIDQPLKVAKGFTFHL